MQAEYTQLKAKADQHQAAHDVMQDLASKKKIAFNSQGDVYIPGIDDANQMM